MQICLCACTFRYVGVRVSMSIYRAGSLGLTLGLQTAAKLKRGGFKSASFARRTGSSVRFMPSMGCGLCSCCGPAAAAFLCRSHQSSGTSYCHCLSYFVMGCLHILSPLIPVHPSAARVTPTSPRAARLPVGCLLPFWRGSSAPHGWQCPWPVSASQEGSGCRRQLQAQAGVSLRNAIMLLVWTAFHPAFPFNPRAFPFRASNRRTMPGPSPLSTRRKRPCSIY